MFKLISSNKIIFLGIFLVIIQTFFGASFDTATKFLGSNNNLLWYHYYALGLSLPMIFFIFFLIISKSVKKNLIFENKKDYFLPLTIVCKNLIFNFYFIYKCLNSNRYSVINLLYV